MPHESCRLQGDREDRRKIKDADVQREKELKVQKDQDERLLEARKLAGMGLSVAEIEEELKRIKMVRPAAEPAVSYSCRSDSGSLWYWCRASQA